MGMVEEKVTAAHEEGSMTAEDGDGARQGAMMTENILQWSLLQPMILPMSSSMLTKMMTKKMTKNSM
ncbi:hypothetical protein AB1Y20_001291 [Prymnesium parvum]|uniref:Uncharacterized protein n=1 Tax=Prymnesium parvum TaxID=97485 RepID=A0AB34K795_PRYPA